MAPASVTCYSLVLKFLFFSDKGPLEPSGPPHCGVCGAVVAPLVMPICHTS